MSNRPIVIVESPYSGDVERNLKYARACIRDCILRGEAPFASHLLYTQPGVLKDWVPEERKLGIQTGFTFHSVAQRAVIYTDLGITSGMQAGIDNAEQLMVPTEYRKLGGKWDEP